MPDASEPAGAGHNSRVGVSHAEIRAWVARIERKKGTKDVAATQLNTERKAARAAGIRLEVLNWAMKLREMERDEAEAILEHLAEYLKALRAEVGPQLVFQFDAAADDDRSEEEIEERVASRAFSDGQLVGLRGGSPTDNPHDANTAAGQQWLAGYHEGVEAGAEIDAPLLDSEAPKRGRAKA